MASVGITRLHHPHFQFRHGNHVYKTMNKKTCCPAFPIRCDAEHFKISKTHKRVLNAVAHFLMMGKQKNDNAEQSRDVCGRDGPMDQSDAITSSSSSSFMRVELQADTSNDVSSCQAAERTESTELDTHVSAGEVHASGRSKSSKQKRWQAQQERMTKRAEKTGVPYEEIMQTYLHSREHRCAKNKPKDIEHYLQQEAPNESAAHTLDVRPVQLLLALRILSGHVPMLIANA